MDSIFGPVPVYFIFMGMSWGLGFELSKFFLKKKKLFQKGFFLLFIGIFLSSWIGSKLLFLLSSARGQAQDLFLDPQFWFGGGFVFFGGLLFSLLFVLLYCLVLKKFKLYALYCCLPAICFSHALGRVGCFFSGCCFGKVCSLPWKAFQNGLYRHPVQIYESFFLIILGVFFIKKVFQEQEKKLKERFFLNIGQYLLLYALIRFFIEFFRGDKVRGIYFGISSSQIISGLIILIILAVILKKKRFYSFFFGP
ncbi:prolipoprotein diacylglyceryl transferase [Bacteriovoracales bacterium]|nr:prolipoprotein diacylglyceryl transferase [Bacteriovoracales bacterium]